MEPFYLQYIIVHVYKNFEGKQRRGRGDSVLAVGDSEHEGAGAVGARAGTRGGERVAGGRRARDAGREGRAPAAVRDMMT